MRIEKLTIVSIKHRYKQTPLQNINFMLKKQILPFVITQITNSKFPSLTHLSHKAHFLL